MIPNTLLSITIPTYNRADFLDYSLEVHVPLARAYNVQIYISDNASTDLTKEVVEKWQQEYPLIYYFHNEINLGPDRNFELALKYPKTEYIWLLGDTYQIPKNGISYLVELISTTTYIYDVIVVNLDNVITIDQQDYRDRNFLLHDLGALMTCLSCLIYQKKIINNGDFSRYRDTNFIQTGIVFEYIANKEFIIRWENNISISGLEHPKLTKKGWYQQAIIFDIACTRWTNFIFSLPTSYSIENKMKSIMDFGKVSHIFTLKNLFLLRNLNILNYKIYKKYSYLFPFTIQYSKLTIFLVAIFPRIAYKPLRFLWRFMKRSN